MSHRIVGGGCFDSSSYVFIFVDSLCYVFAEGGIELWQKNSFIILKCFG